MRTRAVSAWQLHDHLQCRISYLAGGGGGGGGGRDMAASSPIEVSCRSWAPLMALEGDLTLSLNSFSYHYYAERLIAHSHVITNYDISNCHHEEMYPA